MRYDRIAIVIAVILFWLGVEALCRAAVDDCQIVEIYDADKKLHTTIKCETENGDVYYRLNTTEKRVEVVTDGN